MSQIIDGQDWTPVVLSKPKNTSNNVDSNGKPKRKLSDKEIHLLKIENEEVEIKKISLTTQKKIQQARLSKKMSQAEVAKQINVKQSVINEYENGKAVPNNNILGKLEKVLGAKLRGKNK